MSPTPVELTDTGKDRRRIRNYTHVQKVSQVQDTTEPKCRRRRQDRKDCLWSKEEGSSKRKRPLAGRWWESWDPEKRGRAGQKGRPMEGRTRTLEAIKRKLKSAPNRESWGDTKGRRKNEGSGREVSRSLIPEFKKRRVPGPGPCASSQERWGGGPRSVRGDGGRAVRCWTRAREASSRHPRG